MNFRARQFAANAHTNREPLGRGENIGIRDQTQGASPQRNWGEEREAEGRRVK